MTEKRKKIKNWWYYYKWYVICGVILVGIVTDIIGNKLGWFKASPDIQIAYIGSFPLPEETEEELKEYFSSSADDYNHDGRILVQVNQFVSGGAQTADIDSMSYRQASEIALIGDIDDCASYFFLMDDPVQVQREFQVLAMPDGSCPADNDISAEDKVFEWRHELYLGRRCFYNEKRTAYAEECSRLWDKLQGGAKENEKQ